MQIKDAGRYIEYIEFTSGVTAFILVGGLFYEPYESSFKVNKEFISNHAFNQGIGDVTDFRSFTKSFSEKELESVGLTKEILSSEERTSDEEVVELYKRLVPRENWPIIESLKINKNPTIPELRKDFLDMPINDILYLAIYEKDGVKNVTLLTGTQSAYSVDLITGEIMNDPFNYREEGAPFVNIDDTMLETFAFRNQRYAYMSGVIDEYLQDFEMVVTYRDAIDFLQKFPLEEQRDYSKADFSNSVVIKKEDDAKELPKVLYLK